MEFVYGTPSVEEVGGNLWKRAPEDPEVTPAEYKTATRLLRQHLAGRYRLFSGAADGDLYIRGDFFGDRTQYVEIMTPEVICRDFISYLQAWLRDYDEGAWRIVIPTYLDDSATIMVYPSVVRLGSEWEADLDDAYATIVQLMQARKTSENREEKEP